MTTLHRSRPTIGRLLRALGPAWIVMLADVDAASVLTAAKAGTDFGYAILLPLVVLIPVLYLVQEMAARLAIGTGLGHAELIRARYGFRWAGMAVGTMVLIDLLAYVAEFAGIVLGASIVGVPALAAVAGATASLGRRAEARPSPPRHDPRSREARPAETEPMHGRDPAALWRPSPLTSRRAWPAIGAMVRRGTPK